MSTEGMDMVSVGEFYRNRNVLITGGTGFLGKVLLEKLLRSCAVIGTIYLIIRPKKGKTPEERLQQLLSLHNQMSTEGMDMVSVGEFYRNRNVLITGGTGFLGKVLLEKLLRSCAVIGTIYLIIRPKKGKTPEERLQQLLSLHVFDRLHSERPTARNKVVAIEGDLADSNFFLAESDRILLQNVVSVVFHSAAIIKFDEELKFAIKMNIGGTKHMIDLAKRMKNLKAFLYVSTAYSNCDRTHIEEKYYPPQAPNHFWKDLIIAADKMDERELNALTPCLIGKLPNTYTFTKQIAESLAYDYKEEIPLVIYRPSIVIGAFFEPYPGWVDNINGATAIFLGFYTGFLRMLLATADTKQDYMGVDFVVNGAIAAAWYREQLPAGKCPVYNSASGKISQSFNALIPDKLEVPAEKKIWKPRLTLTNNYFWFYINFFVFNVVPAFIIDVILKIRDIDFSFIRVCRKAIKLSRVLSYFSLTSLDIEHENYMELYDKMSADDKITFDFDIVAALKLREQLYLNIFVGIKKYILKEDTSAECTEKLKQRVKYYDAADMAVRIIFYAFVFNAVWNYLYLYLYTYY